MARLNRDTWIALILLLFCAGAFAETFNIRATAFASIGAEVWPRLVLALLTALTLVYLAQSLARGARRGREGDGAPGPPRGLWAKVLYYRNPIWCFALFGAFLVTLPWLGMLLGGVLFVYAMLTVLGPRDPRAHAVHALIAVVAVGGMWAVFTFGLRVILPEGDLLRIW